MQATEYKRCTKCKRNLPRDQFYRDGRESRCKACRCEIEMQRRREQAQRRLKDRSVAMTQRSEALLDALDPAFGNWLAGFIDGEGCFLIEARNPESRWPGYLCSMRLALRDDDRAILEETIDRTGLGKIWLATRRPGQAPQVYWHVLAKADVLALVDLLDRYPLRAKKARDYAIWREAVTIWGQIQKDGTRSDWSGMGRLRAELRTGRVYQAT